MYVPQEGGGGRRGNILYYNMMQLQVFAYTPIII